MIIAMKITRENMHFWGMFPGEVRAFAEPDLKVTNPRPAPDPQPDPQPEPKAAAKRKG